MSFAFTLKDFLVSIGEGERDLENARQKLANFVEFCPQTLFNRLDRDGNGSLTAKELHEFLAANGVHTVEPVEIEVLLNFFSTEGNGSVTLTEF